MATKYREFLERSEEERIELINGEITPLAQPSSEHSMAALRVARSLDAYFGEGGGGQGGWYFFQEVELFLGERAFRPDIFGIRQERLSEIPDRHTLSPDWICEVTSRSNAQHDWVTKMDLYAQYNIPYYWLIDPSLGHRLLAAFSLEPDKSWKLIGSFNETHREARIRPFEAITLDISILFYPKKLLKEEKK